MRISDTRRAQGLERTKRGNQPAAGDDSFADHLKTGQTEGAGAVSAPLAAQPLAGLLSLQEISDEDAAAGRRTMEYGRELLDDLDEIRHGLLLGRLSKQHLRRIADRLKHQLPMVHDATLRELIADIELRVAVELAKLKHIPRFIPAWAGNSGGLSPRSPRRAVHPRVGEEQ